MHTPFTPILSPLAYALGDGRDFCRPLEDLRSVCRAAQAHNEHEGQRGTSRRTARMRGAAAALTALRVFAPRAASMPIGLERAPYGGGQLLRAPVTRLRDDGI